MYLSGIVFCTAGRAFPLMRTLFQAVSVYDASIQSSVPMEIQAAKTIPTCVAMDEGMWNARLSYLHELDIELCCVEKSRIHVFFCIAKGVDVMFRVCFCVTCARTMMYCSHACIEELCLSHAGMNSRLHVPQWILWMNIHARARYEIYTHTLHPACSCSYVQDVRFMANALIKCMCPRMLRVSVTCNAHTQYIHRFTRTSCHF